ncbi:MAG: hypothetical protein Q7R56_03595 [Nanoarchaeota archaeon]|nr:hypothetical protein [Nanoarchaeota archaeon]
MNKKGDLLAEALPGIVTVFLIIIMIVTVIGIANIGIADNNEYYAAALDHYINYVLTTCFAYNDGTQLITGIIDQEKITKENLEQCAHNEFMGITISINQKEQLTSDYYQLTGSGCAVGKKPYSCETKNYRLLINNKGEQQPADITITAIAKHINQKDLIGKTHA